MVYFLGHSSNKLPFLLLEFIKISYVSLHILIFFAFFHFKIPLSVCHPSFKYAIIYLNFFFRCKSQFRRPSSLDLIEKCPFLPLYKSIIAFVVLLLKIHKCFKWVRLPFQPCNVCYKFLWKISYMTLFVLFPCSYIYIHVFRLYMCVFWQTFQQQLYTNLLWNLTI